MTAGGFPTSTGQSIDLSSPNSNLMVELDRVADGLSKHKKVRERIAISVKTNIMWLFVSVRSDVFFSKSTNLNVTLFNCWMIQCTPKEPTIETFMQLCHI